MNEPKFTPGPLHSSSMTMTKSDWAALRCRDMQIVSRGPYVVAAVWSDGIPEKPEDESLQEKANAALIAAAPDLYAALAEIVDTLDASDFAHWVATARAALAKAVSHD